MSPNAQAATSDRLRIVILIGSVREGRLGPHIGRWLADVAGHRDDLEIDLVDLAELQLPVVYPESDDNLPAPVRELGAKLGAADGFVVVTPEYNHGYPAALKNAIDWCYYEWMVKPVGFVSYGGRAQGIRAVEQLRQVFVELHATTIRDGVSFDIDHGLDSSGRPLPTADGAVKPMLDQLAWWSRALRDARARHPYAA